MQVVGYDGSQLPVVVGAVPGGSSYVKSNSRVLGAGVRLTMVIVAGAAWRTCHRHRHVIRQDR